MLVNIDNAIKEINKSFKSIAGDQTKIATMRAINHTLNKGKTALSKEIRTKYKIKASDVKDRITLSKASKNLISGAIKGKGGNISLIYFGARNTKKGVSVNVTGQRKIIPSAFILNVGSGKGVFGRGEYRKGDFMWRKKRINNKGSDLPIQHIKGISVPGAMMERNVLNNTSAVLEQSFKSRLGHEISRLIRT